MAVRTISLFRYKHTPLLHWRHYANKPIYYTSVYPYFYQSIKQLTLWTLFARYKTLQCMSLAVKVRCLHHSFNMPLSSKTDCLILYMEGVKKKKNSAATWNMFVRSTKHIHKTYNSLALWKKLYSNTKYFERQSNIDYNDNRFPMHKIGNIFIFLIWFQLDMIKKGRRGWSE